ncbi:MAG: hypothetical protein AAGB34_02220 [Planctomycetota bacterium]
MNTPNSTYRSWLSLALLLGILSLAAVPLGIFEAQRPTIVASEDPNIKIGPFPTSEAHDQDLYHMVVIERFSEQLPAVNLKEYPSATTPFYHLLQGVVYAFTGGSKWALIGINLLIMLGLVAVVWRIAALRSRPWRGAILTALLAFNIYTFGSGVWLTTDNLAWLFVALAIGLVVFGPATHLRIILAAILVTLAVLTRQVHIWAIAPVGLAALMRTPLVRFAPAFVRHESDESNSTSWSYFATAFVCAIPFMALGVFYFMWGGLTQQIEEGILEYHGLGYEPAGLVFGLAMVGILGVFVLTLILPTALRTLRSPTAWIIAVVTIALATIPSTSRILPPPPLETTENAVVSAQELEDYEAQKNASLARGHGWVWKLPVQKIQVAAAPLFDQRSPVLILAAGAGAMVLMMLWLGASATGNRGPASVLILTFVGFLIAQAANSAVWQRYYEPMVLITLILLCALAIGKEPMAKARWIGPAVLLAIQLALLSITTGREVANYISAHGF